LGNNLVLREAVSLKGVSQQCGWQVWAKEPGLEKETRFLTHRAGGHTQVPGLFAENGGKRLPVLSRTRAADTKWLHRRKEQFKFKQNFS